MTRLMTLIAAAMLTSTTAVATPSSPNLADSFRLADAPTVEMSADAFIKADMSFMDAMRMISTITLPDLTASAELSSSDTLRIRRVARGWNGGKITPSVAYNL